jgi:hypothetical protein
MAMNKKVFGMLSKIGRISHEKEKIILPRLTVHYRGLDGASKGS